MDFGNDDFELPMKKIKYEDDSDGDSVATVKLEIRTGKDFFNMLPKNVVKRIFHLLPALDLLRCEMVCKRFQECAREASLWKYVSLNNVALKPGALGNILKRPVKHLQLNQVILKDPVIYFEEPYYTTNTKILELCKVNATTNSIAHLLIRCYTVEKLIVEGIKFDNYVCMQLAKCYKLNYLKVINCFGIESWKLLQKLNHLSTLIVSLENATVCTVATLIEYIPFNLIFLNVDNCPYEIDVDLKAIVAKCENLQQVTLMNCNGITPKAIQYLYPYKQLRSLIFINCPKIGSSLSIKFVRAEENNIRLQVDGIVDSKAYPLIEKILQTIIRNDYTSSTFIATRILDMNTGNM